MTAKKPKATPKTTKLTPICSMQWTAGDVIVSQSTEYECSNCKGIVQGDVTFMRYCYQCGARVK